MDFPSILAKEILSQQDHLRFKPTYTTGSSHEGVSRVTGTGVASFCVPTVVVTRTRLSALIYVCKIGENSECPDIFNVIHMYTHTIPLLYHSIRTTVINK